jgi:hypothetical protein
MLLVERMLMAPCTCFHCGAGHVADESGEVGPFLDLQRDINWGDNAYLCQRCCDEIAALWGYIAEDQKVQMERAIANKDSDIHDLRAEVDSLKRRMKVITAGSRTLKRVRAGA